MQRIDDDGPKSTNDSPRIQISSRFHLPYAEHAREIYSRLQVLYEKREAELKIEVVTLDSGSNTPILESKDGLEFPKSEPEVPLTEHQHWERYRRKHLDRQPIGYSHYRKRRLYDDIAEDMKPLQWPEEYVVDEEEDIKYPVTPLRDNGFTRFRNVARKMNNQTLYVNEEEHDEWSSGECEVEEGEMEEAEMEEVSEVVEAINNDDGDKEKERECDNEERSDAGEEEEKGNDKEKVEEEVESDEEEEVEREQEEEGAESDKMEEEEDCVNGANVAKGSDGGEESDEEEEESDEEEEESDEEEEESDEEEEKEECVNGASVAKGSDEGEESDEDEDESDEEDEEESDEEEEEEECVNGANVAKGSDEEEESDEEDEEESDEDEEEEESDDEEEEKECDNRASVAGCSNEKRVVEIVELSDSGSEERTSDTSDTSDGESDDYYTQKKKQYRENRRIYEEYLNSIDRVVGYVEIDDEDEDSTRSRRKRKKGTMVDYDDDERERFGPELDSSVSDASISDASVSDASDSDSSDSDSSDSDASGSDSSDSDSSDSDASDSDASDSDASVSDLLVSDSSDSNALESDALESVALESDSTKSDSSEDDSSDNDASEKDSSDDDLSDYSSDEVEDDQDSDIQFVRSKKRAKNDDRSTDNESSSDNSEVTDDEYGEGNRYGYFERLARLRREETINLEDDEAVLTDEEIEIIGEFSGGRFIKRRRKVPRVRCNVDPLRNKYGISQTVEIFENDPRPCLYRKKNKAFQLTKKHGPIKRSRVTRRVQFHPVQQFHKENYHDTELGAVEVLSLGETVIDYVAFSKPFYPTLGHFKDEVVPTAVEYDNSVKMFHFGRSMKKHSCKQKRMKFQTMWWARERKPFEKPRSGYFEHPSEPIFPIDLDPMIMAQHIANRENIFSHLERVRDAIMYRLIRRRADNKVIKDTSYFVREFFLMKAAISMRSTLAAEIPECFVPPMMRCGYFPHCATKEGDKMDYLMARFVEAQIEYFNLNYRSIKPLKGFIASRISREELYDYHKTGRHIHGFFLVWERLDDYFEDWDGLLKRKRYLVDMFNQIRFPLYIPWPRWENRLKAAFDKVTLYNLHLAEVLRMNRPVFDAICQNPAFFQPISMREICRMMTNSGITPKYFLNSVGRFNFYDWARATANADHLSAHMLICGGSKKIESCKVRKKQRPLAFTRDAHNMVAINSKGRGLQFISDEPINKVYWGDLDYPISESIIRPPFAVQPKFKTHLITDLEKPVLFESDFYGRQNKRHFEVSMSRIELISVRQRIYNLPPTGTPERYSSPSPPPGKKKPGRKAIPETEKLLDRHDFRTAMYASDIESDYEDCVLSRGLTEREMPRLFRSTSSESIFLDYRYIEDGIDRISWFHKRKLEKTIPQPSRQKKQRKMNRIYSKHSLRFRQLETEEHAVEEMLCCYHGRMKRTGLEIARTRNAMRNPRKFITHNLPKVYEFADTPIFDDVIKTLKGMVTKVVAKETANTRACNGFSRNLQEAVVARRNLLIKLPLTDYTELPPPIFLCIEMLVNRPIYNRGQCNQLIDNMKTEVNALVPGPNDETGWGRIKRKYPRPTEEGKEMDAAEVMERMRFLERKRNRHALNARNSRADRIDLEKLRMLRAKRAKEVREMKQREERRIQRELEQAEQQRRILQKERHEQLLKQKEKELREKREKEREEEERKRKEEEEQKRKEEEERRKKEEKQQRKKKEKERKRKEEKEKERRKREEEEEERKRKEEDERKQREEAEKKRLEAEKEKEVAEKRAKDTEEERKRLEEESKAQKEREQKAAQDLAAKEARKLQESKERKERREKERKEKFERYKMEKKAQEEQSAAKKRAQEEEERRATELPDEMSVDLLCVIRNITNPQFKKAISDFKRIKARGILYEKANAWSTVFFANSGIASDAVFEHIYNLLETVPRSAGWLTMGEEAQYLCRNIAKCFQYTVVEPNKREWTFAYNYEVLMESQDPKLRAELPEMMEAYEICRRSIRSSPRRDRVDVMKRSFFNNSAAGSSSKNTTLHEVEDSSREQSPSKTYSFNKSSHSTMPVLRGLEYLNEKSKQHHKTFTVPDWMTTKPQSTFTTPFWEIIEKYDKYQCDSRPDLDDEITNYFETDRDFVRCDPSEKHRWVHNIIGGLAAYLCAGYSLSGHEDIDIDISNGEMDYAVTELIRIAHFFYAAEDCIPRFPYIIRQNGFRPVTRLLEHLVKTIGSMAACGLRQRAVNANAEQVLAKVIGTLTECVNFHMLEDLNIDISHVRTFMKDLKLTRGAINAHLKNEVLVCTHGDYLRMFRTRTIVMWFTEVDSLNYLIKEELMPFLNRLTERSEIRDEVERARKDKMSRELDEHYARLIEQSKRIMRKKPVWNAETEEQFYTSAKKAIAKMAEKDQSHIQVFKAPTDIHINRQRFYKFHRMQYGKGKDRSVYIQLPGNLDTDQRVIESLSSTATVLSPSSFNEMQWSVETENGKKRAIEFFTDLFRGHRCAPKWLRLEGKLYDHLWFMGRMLPEGLCPDSHENRFLNSSFCPGCTTGDVILIHNCVCEENPPKENVIYAFHTPRDSSQALYGRFVCKHGPSSILEYASNRGSGVEKSVPATCNFKTFTVKVNFEDDILSHSDDEKTEGIPENWDVSSISDLSEGSLELCDSEMSDDCDLPTLTTNENVSLSRRSRKDLYRSKSSERSELKRYNCYKNRRRYSSAISFNETEYHIRKRAERAVDEFRKPDCTDLSKPWIDDSTLTKYLMNDRYLLIGVPDMENLKRKELIDLMLSDGSEEWKHMTNLEATKNHDAYAALLCKFPSLYFCGSPIEEEAVPQFDELGNQIAGLSASLVLDEIYRFEAFKMRMIDEAANKCEEGLKIWIDDESPHLNRLIETYKLILDFNLALFEDLLNLIAEHVFNPMACYEVERTQDPYKMLQVLEEVKMRVPMIINAFFNVAPMKRILQELIAIERNLTNIEMEQEIDTLSRYAIESCRAPALLDTCFADAKWLNSRMNFNQTYDFFVFNLEETIPENRSRFEKECKDLCYDFEDLYLNSSKYVHNRRKFPLLLYEATFEQTTTWHAEAKRYIGNGEIDPIAAAYYECQTMLRLQRVVRKNRKCFLQRIEIEYSKDISKSIVFAALAANPSVRFDLVEATKRLHQHYSKLVQQVSDVTLHVEPSRLGMVYYIHGDTIFISTVREQLVKTHPSSTRSFGRSLNLQHFEHLHSCEDLQVKIICNTQTFEMSFVFDTPKLPMKDDRVVINKIASPLMVPKIRWEDIVVAFRSSEMDLLRSILMKQKWQTPPRRTIDSMEVSTATIRRSQARLPSIVVTSNSTPRRPRQDVRGPSAHFPRTSDESFTRQELMRYNERKRKAAFEQQNQSKFPKF